MRKLRSHIQERAFHRETTVMEGLENARATKAFALENATMKNSDNTQVNSLLMFFNNIFIREFILEKYILNITIVSFVEISKSYRIYCTKMW